MRLLSLKIKKFNIQENRWQFALILLAAAIILWGLFVVQIMFAIIPIVILSYIILSITKNIQEHGL